MGNLLAPAVNWLVILLLLSPAVSLIAVTLIVRGSARARSVEESQQSAVFSHYSDNSAGGGQFTGNHAAECVDPAGNKPDLCTAGMDSAEEGGRQIYV